MRAFSNTTIMFHIRIDRCYRYVKNKRYVLLTIHIHIQIDKNTDRLLDGQIDIQAFSEHFLGNFVDNKLIICECKPHFEK